MLPIVWMNLLSEPTFRNLFKDLAIFFGCVAAFVVGFLALSYVLQPSSNPYGFWLGFLLYIYGYSRILRWLSTRKFRN